MSNATRLVGVVVPALFSLSALAQEAPPLIWGVEFEQLEYRLADGSDVLAWDADGILGSDEWRLRVLSQAEYAFEEDAFERLENQVLLQRPIANFFDAKAGVRFDTPTGPDRVYGTIGIQGLAPQWIEVDLDFFVSGEGDLSARLDAEYEAAITNRISLVTSLEFDFPFTDDEEIEVAAGAPFLEVGARLGYDLIDRAVAPYVGINYERAFGETGALRREAGEEDESLAAVFGVRLLF